MASSRVCSLVICVALLGCGDDSDPGQSDAGTSTGTPDPGSESGMSSSVSMSSSTVAPTTGGQTTSGSTTTGPACDADVEPLSANDLPRCEAATLECWLGCTGPDQHACRAACTAADPTPAVLVDGLQINCGRCINKMFGACWHDVCPAEVQTSRCCAVNSGCNTICIDHGPCSAQDLECLRDACGPDFEAESTCLQDGDGLEACRLQNDGLATACFAVPG